MDALDPERLKQIIVEEVRRALTESAAPAAFRPREASPAGPASKLEVDGLVLITGTAAPHPAMFEALAPLAIHGLRFVVLASQSFRGVPLARDPDLLRGLRLAEGVDDERGLADLLNRTGWVLAPDVSSNTLAKAVLGVEDSQPTRVIAWALRSARPIVFLECPSVPGPAADLGRLERLRRLERRGALLADARSVLARLVEALRPAEARLFQPLAARPIPRRRIVTAEDVDEVWRAGRRDWTLPPEAIVTAEAEEQAARRGIELRRGDSPPPGDY